LLFVSKKLDSSNMLDYYLPNNYLSFILKSVMLLSGRPSVRTGHTRLTPALRLVALDPPRVACTPVPRVLRRAPLHLRLARSHWTCRAITPRVADTRPCLTPSSPRVACCSRLVHRDVPRPRLALRPPRPRQPSLGGSK